LVAEPHDSQFSAPNRGKYGLKRFKHYQMKVDALLENLEDYEMHLIERGTTSRPATGDGKVLQIGVRTLGAAHGSALLSLTFKQTPERYCLGGGEFLLPGSDHRGLQQILSRCNVLATLREMDTCVLRDNFSKLSSRSEFT
jgi:hypothetical protein